LLQRFVDAGGLGLLASQAAENTRVLGGLVPALGILEVWGIVTGQFATGQFGTVQVNIEGMKEVYVKSCDEFNRVTGAERK
jgi:hypothetical protein